MNDVKNCCNIDFDEIESLKNSLFNYTDQKELNRRSEIFKALAEIIRLEILYLLKFKDLYVCEVMAVLDKPQSTVSHHLNVLKKAGFIKRRKEGIWSCYSLKNHEIMSFIDALCEVSKLD